MADALTPDASTKTSTVGGLLASVKNGYTSLISGLTSSAGTSAKTDGTSTSLLTSPFVWVGVAVVAVVVYLKKFRKPSRKGVRIR